MSGANPKDCMVRSTSLAPTTSFSCRGGGGMRDERGVLLGESEGVMMGYDDMVC